jgi:hypothetical protein
MNPQTHKKKIKTYNRSSKIKKTPDPFIIPLTDEGPKIDIDVVGLMVLILVR